MTNLNIIEVLKKNNISYLTFNNGYHLKISKHINLYPTTNRIFNNITGDNYVLNNEKELIDYINNKKKGVRIIGL